jgi:hypothetical protein
MRDLDRFRTLDGELRTFARQMAPLTKMPERATREDLQRAVDLTKKAADSLEELLKAPLPGCICRHIGHDSYNYLDYAESCRHHGQLYVLREHLQAEHAKRTKALTNEVRLKLIAAALSGAATLDSSIVDYDRKVKLAIDIADEVIDRLVRENA